MARADRRSGDVLGLGGAGSSGSNDDASILDTSAAATDQAKRRRRMSDGADELTPGTGDLQQSSGATGIDMGAGGEGTDIE
jgi:hypothetical protein